MNYKAFDCSILPLNKIHNRAGNLTFVESDIHVPFNIKRIYYLYDIPSGVTRGGHAHKNLYQLIVAVSGSFSVLLDDGECKRVVHLNRPDFGLLIVPSIWREIFDFSSGAITLVMASELFDKNDYINNYDEFIKIKKDLL